MGLIETEIKMIDTYYYAEQYHQQYLASSGRTVLFCLPTKVKLGEFSGSNFKLKEDIWENFNWEVDKCVLRSDNNPIKKSI